MVHRLEKMPDGSWYRFGDGVPRKATDDEVVLWQASREVALDEVGGQKRGWQLVTQLAIAGTTVVAAFTFLVLLFAWVRISSFHWQLGTIELAYPDFLASPVHPDGVITLVVSAALASIVYMMSLNFYQFSVARWPHSPARALALAIAVGVGSGGIMVASGVIVTGDPAAALVMLAFLPAFAAIPGWLRLTDRALPAAGPNCVLWLRGLCLGSVVWYLVATFYLSPSQLGCADAASLRDGQSDYPVVSLVTSHSLPIGQGGTPDDQAKPNFLYAAVPVTSAVSGAPTYSLRLLGQTSEAMLLYEAERDLIHRVPVASVVELIVHPTATSKPWRLFPSSSEPEITNMPVLDWTPHANQSMLQP